LSRLNPPWLSGLLPPPLPAFPERFAGALGVLCCRPLVGPLSPRELSPRELSRPGPDPRLGGPAWPWPLGRSELPACSPCPRDSCPCCANANTEIVRDAKTKTNVRRTLSLRVREFIYSLQIS
jgi:hypothetical protein